MTLEDDLKSILSIITYPAVAASQQVEEIIE
jgi:hypothetical protein